VAESTFLTLTEYQLVRWVYDLEDQHQSLAGDVIVLKQYYNENKPKTGQIDVLGEIGAQVDGAYWSEYSSRITRLESWLKDQAPRVDAIKAFGRARFPNVRFWDVHVLPSAPAPRYPDLPPNPPFNHAPRPPSGDTRGRIK
jgi:hypothetical protein